MRRFLIALIAAAAVGTLPSAKAQAEEFDLMTDKGPTKEQMKRSEDLPATLVIRTNDANGEMEVYHCDERLDKMSNQDKIHHDGKWRKMKIQDRVMNGDDEPFFSDLSRPRRVVPWAFGFVSSLLRPRYYYYGYNYDYRPYYSYRYPGYSYRYYNWPYRRW